MNIHEINCLIARYSADPENDEAMARARFYAALRDAMLGPADAAERPGGDEEASDAA